MRRESCQGMANVSRSSLGLRWKGACMGGRSECGKLIERVRWIVQVSAKARAELAGIGEKARATRGTAPEREFFRRGLSKVLERKSLLNSLRQPWLSIHFHIWIDEVIQRFAGLRRNEVDISPVVNSTRSSVRFPK